MDHFKDLFELVNNIIFVLCFDFLMLRHAGSELPNQRLNLQPPELEGKALTTGPPGKSLESNFK